MKNKQKPKPPPDWMGFVFLISAFYLFLLFLLQFSVFSAQDPNEVIVTVVSVLLMKCSSYMSSSSELFSNAVKAGVFQDG